VKYQKVVCVPQGWELLSSESAPSAPTILAVELLKLPLGDGRFTLAGKKSHCCSSACTHLCPTFQFSQRHGVYEMGWHDPAINSREGPSAEDIKLPHSMTNSKVVEQKKNGPDAVAALAAKQGTAKAARGVP